MPKLSTQQNEKQPQYNSQNDDEGVNNLICNEEELFDNICDLIDEFSNLGLELDNEDLAILEKLIEQDQPLSEESFRKTMEAYSKISRNFEKFCKFLVNE